DHLLVGARRVGAVGAPPLPLHEPPALCALRAAQHVLWGWGVGRNVRGVLVESRTPSGRVGRLAITTDAGRYELRGNDIRYVLRPSGGEILNSTYFTVETEARRDGSLARLIVRGNGYGHGIGMCQWGAIGRARAGQTARTILAAYYPGTTVGPIQ
ncbi:MAG: hypothetical protein ACHQQ3_03255, partial [Gemmatimonadales bacterium]